MPDCPSAVLAEVAAGCDAPPSLATPVAAGAEWARRLAPFCGPPPPAQGAEAEAGAGGDGDARDPSFLLLPGSPLAALSCRAPSALAAARAEVSAADARLCAGRDTFGSVGRLVDAAAGRAMVQVSARRGAAQAAAPTF